MSTVDLNNTFKYDKVVINLNNENCLTNNSTEASFYVDLVEPLRNIIFIKIIRASVLTSPGLRSSPLLLYKRYEPIYIAINDYRRSVSYLKTNNIFDNIGYFDLIPYSDTEYSEISYSQSAFDWTDPSVYILNPPEQNLRRLNIEFRDKKFKLFESSMLTDFNLSICIYYIKNRV